MDTWDPVLHDPGSWLWQSSRKAPPVSQFGLWWLLSSVRDSELGYLLRDFYQEQAISPDSPLAWSLRSCLLMELGARSGSQAARPLCCGEQAVASRLPKVCW